MALDAGCDMVLVCNNPAGADEVLDALADYHDPVAQTRLVRLHGRHGQPLALALVSLLGTFAYGVIVKGIGGFVKGYLTPLVIFDVIGYVSRTMSLTLRLFGNVIGGEIVIAVIAMIAVLAALAVDVGQSIQQVSRRRVVP